MVRDTLTIVALAAVAACASGPGTGSASSTRSAAVDDSRLLGTWELVSTRATRGDTVVMEGSPPTLTAIKILNATHYAVITHQNGQFRRAGSGRYTLAGDRYTEMLEAGSTQYPAGASAAFTISFDGDTWTTEGGTERTRFREVWRRVR